MKALGVSTIIVFLLGAAALLCLQTHNDTPRDTEAYAGSDLTGLARADSPAPLRLPLTLPLTNPRVVVFKSRRQLELYANNEVVRAYRIGLGTSPVDDKVREGDKCTPEGEFYICRKNPKSSYYLSLGLSYPNKEDAERGLRDRLITRDEYDRITKAINRRGVPPQKTALGGDIFIHGDGSQSDWTLGCVALDNLDVKELYEVVPIGTTVIIKP